MVARLIKESPVAGTEILHPVLQAIVYPKSGLYLGLKGPRLDYTPGILWPRPIYTSGYKLA